MRLAIVTNILTPYRMRFYSEMNKQLVEAGGALKVFVMTKDLPLRPWNYDDLKDVFTELMPGNKIMYKGQDMLFNFSINRRLKKFGPDIVILAGSWTYATSWQMMMKKLTGAKYYFWTESHNVRATPVRSKSGFFAHLKANFYKRFEGYCVPGKYATETLNGLVDNHGERVRLPNLVDNEYYSESIEMRKSQTTFRKLHNLPLDKKVFVTPARLITIKGMDTFLSQIADNKHRQEAVFVLAGEGPLENDIKEIATSSGIDVRLMGYCNQSKVRELYAAADFFLLPSLLDSNPLTVIEGAFSGLPLCISRYVGNSPELGIDKQNGVVFDTVVKDSVIEAFDFVMNASKDWVSEAGSKAYSVAKENFCTDNETRKLLSYFETQISRS